MAIDHLFSIPLGQYKLKNFAKHKKALINLLTDDYDEADDKNRKADNWKCNSFQTWLWGNGQEELVNDLYKYIDEYLIEFGFNSFSYKVESWFNIYGKQQYQERHGHCQSLIAGMVVLQYDPKQHTPLRFINPYPEVARNFEKFDCRATNFKFMSDSLPLPMEEGMIYLWPSTLNHLVPPQPNNCKDLRITFTFNVDPDHQWDNTFTRQQLTESQPV